MSATTDCLLDRLEGVKPCGPSRWVAKCPAHDDKNPSLSIRELDDGRILIHDFAGCGAADILAAVGMELRDLFPSGARDHYLPPLTSNERRIPWRDIAHLLAREALVVVIAGEDIARGEALTEADRARLIQATERLRRGAEQVAPSKFSIVGGANGRI